MPKTPEPESIPQDIDELGRLEAEGVPAKYARLSALRKKISESVPEGTVETTLRGRLYGAIVGARGMKRSINLVKLFQRITPKAFLAALRPDAVTLETLGKFPEKVQAGLITESQTGPRSVKTFQMAVELPKAA
jgi:hypothetical protein